MTTYFVRKTGNDGTGNGSTATPWLTINKALATLAAGDTLKIGAGTYAENSSSLGYLYITGKAYASTVIFESESGLNDVIITGTGVAFGCRINASQNISLNNITILAPLGANSQAFDLRNGGNISNIYLTNQDRMT